jgi:hypothetical protein
MRLSGEAGLFVQVCLLFARHVVGVSAAGRWLAEGLLSVKVV